jgi:hypothetical protein
VKKLISTIFLSEESGEYKQCGVALRMSGSIDFYWQFRVVDSQKVEDIVVDGYVEDIDSDFGFIYFIKIEITDASDLIK